MYQSFNPAIAHDFSSKSVRALPAWEPMRIATTRLFGLDIVKASRRDMAEELVGRAIHARRTQVAFINAHCINTAANDRAYRRALGGADLLLPDGSGLRAAARMAGTDFGENLNGTDLFPLICEQAARKGAKLYLLGGVPGVATKAGLNMIRRFPGLQIVGAQHGYFERHDTARVLRDINASGADMLFVGFGVPLQECWLADHGASLDTPVQLAVGGLFDYYSGRIPRAPENVRAMGCEWVWRLAQEPKRLARRYVLGNAVFLARAAAHAFTQRSGWNPVAAIKRAGDFLAVLLGLLILAPVFAAIALAIKLEDGGPVFFSQTRIGAGGKPFRVWKFRSMVTDAERVRKELEAHSERDGVCFKMRRDPRITRIGAMLRRTSLDELPQLFNVLGGEMSLVGPRPALPQEVAAYWDRALQRLDAKPGITCVWQVSGRAEIPFAEQVEMDIDYVERHGPLRDVSLLARTIPAVLTGRGAY